MFALKRSNRLFVLATAAMLLAGCATTPAPVVNHSFGGSSPQPAETPPAQPAPPSSGAQTFGLGGQPSPQPAPATTTHANGTLSANGYSVAQGDTLYSIAFAHGMDVRDLAALNAIPPPYVLHPGQVLKLKPGQGSVAATTTTTVTTTSRPAAPATPATSQPSAPVFGAVTQQTMGANGVAPAESMSTTTAAPSVVPVAGEPVPPPAPPAVVPPRVPLPAPGGTRAVAGITWQWPASGKLIGGFSAGGSGGDGAGLDIAGNMGDPVRAAAAGTVVYSGDGLPGFGELIIIKHNDTYLSAYGHNSKRLVKEGEHVAAGQEIALMGATGASRVELHFEIRKDGKPVDPLGYLPQR